MKCLVHGCQNHSYQNNGRQITEASEDGVRDVQWVCSPCWESITTGQGSPDSHETVLYSSITGRVVVRGGRYIYVRHDQIDVEYMTGFYDKDELVSWVAQMKPPEWKAILTKLL